MEPKQRVLSLTVDHLVDHKMKLMSRMLVDKEGDQLNMIWKILFLLSKHRTWNYSAVLQC